MKNCVYLLWHSYESELSEDEKLVGAYASESDAKLAIERLKNKPGFCYYPDGFEISECRLGQDIWESGFAVMTAIYVRDGTEHTCVTAAKHPNNIYEICSIDEGSNPEFKTGDFVRCKEFNPEPGVTDLLAIEKVLNDL